MTSTLASSTSEARFTPPTARCPHPERWSSADADSTEHEVGVLLAGLVRGLQPEVVVETGTCHAKTSVLIADSLAENGHGFLVTIESDPGRAQAAQQTLTQYGHVQVIQGSSLDWTPSHPIDLLFLDSAWDTRIPEFHRFAPWLHTGSVVAIHDTANHKLWRQVQTDIVANYPVAAIDLPTPRGLTLLTVTG